MLNSSTWEIETGELGIRFFLAVWKFEASLGYLKHCLLPQKKKKKKGRRRRREKGRKNLKARHWRNRVVQVIRHWKWLHLSIYLLVFLFPTVPLCTTKKRWLWVLRRTVDGYWTPLHCSYKYSGRSRMPYTTQGALEAFLGLGSSVFWLQQYLLCTDELSYVDNLG